MEHLYNEGVLEEVLNENVIIIMDTNVWLDLYNLSPATIKLIVNSIEENEKLFWMPNQVFIEFNRHVVKNRDGALNRYKNLKKSMCDTLNNAISNINTQTSMLKNKGNIEAITVCDDIIKQLKEQINTIGEEIEKINEKYIKETECISKDNDIIESLINFLYQNRDSAEFSIKELMDIYEEGEKRYKYKIPPGYTDQNKKETGESESQFLLRKYGDLILWKEILRKISNSNLNLIFVENERKSDWWDKKESDNTNIPRVLKEEFKVSNHGDYKFLMIDFEEFIYHYGNQFNLPDTSIQEITMKLKYHRSLIEYLEENKRKLAEEYIREEYEDSYSNIFCDELSELGFFGGSVDNIEDFIIDNINIINSELIEDDTYDIRSIENEVEMECTAYITSYINKYVYHSGRIKVKFCFDFRMEYLLDISNRDLKCEHAIELNDTYVDGIYILNASEDEFDIDVCVDEDIFRDR